MQHRIKRYYGFILCGAITALSYFLGLKFPLIGGAVFAILIGIIINNTTKLDSAFEFGINYSSNSILKLSIIFIGASLNISEIFILGRQSVSIMLGTLLAALIMGFILGRLLKIGSVMTVLISVGTAICGGSAIAAVSGIINAKKDQISFAISTIFLYNIIAVIIFPFIGHILNMGQLGFGIFAGTAVNDTSSVVATASVYGNKALEVATITKLARTTMIVPICLILAFIVSVYNKNKGNSRSGNYSFAKTFPWFVLWFLVMSLFSTVILRLDLPAFIVGIPKIFSFLGKLMIVMALAGVGLGTDIKTFQKVGYKPVLLGFLLWIIVVFTSILLQIKSGLM